MAARIYLENTNPGHSKFWTATLSNRAVLCTWGRIGSGGQSKAFNFGSTLEAVSFFNRKMDEKLRKGYYVAIS